MRDYQSGRAQGATATRPRTAAARPTCARRCRSPTCSARPASATTQARHPRAAGRRAAVLLAGGDHRRPQDGEARVRDPADAARPAAEGDRRRCATRLDPPRGRDARGSAGLQVLGAEANATLSSPLRRLGDAAGRAARGRAGAAARLPALGARAGCRSCRSRWPPAGRRSCCSLLRVPLNPMSATLGALVIAISTEFAVLLTARYREERAARARAARRAAAHLRVDRRGGGRLGRDRDRRLRGARALRRADAARLRARDRRRPTVSLLGVLAVLPAVLVLAERARAARRRPRRRRAWRSPRSRHERARAAARPPAGTSRYTWIVGVLVVLGLAYITLNTLGTEKPGSRGVPDGRAAAAVRASPLATVEARRATRRSTASQGVQGARPATSSTRASWPSAARSCSAFFATRSQALRAAGRRARARCARASPTSASRRWRSAATAATCAPLVRKRGWGMPVGYDHDGAVANAYAVGGLPDDHVRAPRREGGGHVVRLLGEAALAARRSEALR